MCARAVCIARGRCACTRSSSVLVALSAAFFLSLLAVQKADRFCNDSTNDTRHQFGSHCNGWPPVRFITTRTSAAESLNTCPSWPFRELGTHLFHNHISRIALTASANALAPSSPIWFSLRRSSVIDGLALSCFGLRSQYLNLVSHGDQMTALRKQIALCTPNRVCQ